MVCRSICPGTGGSSRGDIDDVTGVLSFHDGQCCPGKQKWASQINANHAVPLLDSHFINREGIVNRRAIDDDVQTSKLFVNLLHRPKDGFSIAYITLERHAPNTILLKVMTNSLNGLSMDVNAGNRTAGESESMCRCLTKAASCTCDEDHFPLQNIVRHYLYCCLSKCGQT